MTIYISGQMTGIYNYNFDKFNEVATMLKKDGYYICNPVDILKDLAAKDKIEIYELQRKDIMKNCIYSLLFCDAIYLIDGWEESDGACLEADIASELELKVYTESVYRTEHK